MSKSMKIRLIIGLFVTVIIIYFSVKSLQGIDTSELFTISINWIYVAVSVIIYVYANYIRGLAYTRGIDKNISQLNGFEIVGIGHAANMVLPLHAGEGLRAAYFPKDYSAAKRTKLLIIPAYADFVAIMILALIAVPFAGFQDKNLLIAVKYLCIVCVAGILSVVVIFFIPKLRSYIEEYMNISLVKMFFWVMLSWILLLISTWFGFLALGFSSGLSMRMTLAVFAATNIINFIPASPGAIGLFEYGVILGLAGLGIDQSKSLAIGILLHVIQYIALLPLGVILNITAFHGKYGEIIKRKFNKKQNDKASKEK